MNYKKKQGINIINSSHPPHKDKKKEKSQLMTNKLKSINSRTKQEKNLKYTNQTANNQLRNHITKDTNNYLFHAPIFSDFQIFI